MFRKITVFFITTLYLSIPLVQAFDGTIFFHGSVINSPFIVDDGDDTLIINMSRLDYPINPKAGDSIGPAAQTTINMIRDQSNSANPYISFSGMTTGANNDLFQLNQTGTEGVSSGVGVALTLNNTRLIPNEAQAIFMDDSEASDKNYALHLNLQYVATGGEITGGSINFTTNLAITYP